MSSTIRFYPGLFSHEEMMKVTRSRLSRVISNICHRIWPDIRLAHFYTHHDGKYEYAAFCNEAGVPACWAAWSEGEDDNFRIGCFETENHFNSETVTWSRSTNPQYTINVINKKFAERGGRSFADQVRTLTLDYWKRMLASNINTLTFYVSEGFHKASPAESIILSPSEMWHYMDHKAFPTSAVEKFGKWEDARKRTTQGFIDNYKKLHGVLGQEKWFITRKRIQPDNSLWMVGSIQFAPTFITEDEETKFGVRVLTDADKILTPVMPKLYKNFCDIPQEVQAKLAMLEPYFEARGVQPLRRADIDGYYPALSSPGHNRIYDDISLLDVFYGESHMLLINK